MRRFVPVPLQVYRTGKITVKTRAALAYSRLGHLMRTFSRRSYPFPTFCRRPLRAPRRDPPEDDRLLPSAPHNRQLTAVPRAPHVPEPKKKPPSHAKPPQSPAALLTRCTFSPERNPSQQNTADPASPFIQWHRDSKPAQRMLTGCHQQSHSPIRLVFFLHFALFPSSRANVC